MTLIDYRAWNPNTHIMHYNVCIINGLPIIRECVSIHQLTVAQAGIPLVGTGAEDKYGCQVYEGDVLSLSYRGFVFEIASVTFDRGAFWIYYHSTDDKELLYDALDGVELTIIGNIYEGF